MTTPRDTEIEGLLLDLLGAGTAVSLHVVEVHDHVGADVLIREPGAESQEPFAAAAMHGIRANPGDIALAVRLGATWFVVNTMADEDDVDVQYLTGEDLPFGGDGSGNAVAYANHQHRGASGNAFSLELGGGTSVSRGMAIGSGAEASDASVAIGITAKAFGYLGQVIGYGASILEEAQRGIAIGYNAAVTANYGVAVGDNAGAGSQGTAIGQGAKATGSGSLALGSTSSATAIRSSAIGYNVTNSRSDTAKVRAERLIVESSLSSNNGRSGLELTNSSGTQTVMFLTSSNTIEVWTGNNSSVIGAAIPTANKRISASGGRHFRVGPHNNHGSIALLYSALCYDTGYRITGDEAFAYVWAHGYGWGWMPANTIVAI